MNRKYISNQQTYLINKYLTSVFVLIVFIILTISIFAIVNEYKVFILITLLFSMIIIYFTFINKFLFLKRLYIEDNKLFAEERGVKKQIFKTEIKNIKRNKFFYHSGLYCLSLNNKSKFNGKIYFTTKVFKNINPSKIISANVKF